MSRRWSWLALLVPALLLWPPLRQPAEATMLRHMLLVFPLLLAAGWWFSGVLSARGYALFARWSGLGFPGLIFVTAVLTIWMIPNALDMATARWQVDLAKTLSMFAAGAVLALSARHASLVIQTFFVGNWVTMTVFVGVLFQSVDARLCNAYLASDQLRTGQGLVVLAALAGGAWGWRVWQRRERLAHPPL